jgi:hypothetical protein
MLSSAHTRMGRRSWCTARASASAKELEASRLACEKDIRLSSLLLIAYECMKRARKPLFDCHDDEVLTVPNRLHQMACCLLIADTDHTVTYLNQAAQEHLLMDNSTTTSFATIDHWNSSSSAHNALSEWSDKTPLAGILEPGDVRGIEENGIHISSASCMRSLGPNGRSYQVKRLISCDLLSPSTRIMGKAFLWDEWTFEADDGRKALGRPLSPPIHINEATDSHDRYRASLDEVEEAQALADSLVREVSDEIKRLKSSEADKKQVDEGVMKLQAAKRRAESVKRLAQSYGPMYKSLIDAYLTIARSL